MPHGMQAPQLLKAEQQHSWRQAAPGIWSCDLASPRENAAHALLVTLLDQPRWLEARYLYDEQGSELFERICELPEYYLTRTENWILEKNAGAVIDAAPVEAIVELGAGSSKKTVHLLREQARRRGRGIFAPIDVSLSSLLGSRDFVRSATPEIAFHGLHALYETGLAGIDYNLPTLFAFLGSSIGNFSQTELPRFFQRLAAAMGPGDFFLLGVDRPKAVEVLEKAYNDSQGVTAAFILNALEHANRLLGANFSRDRMRYACRYNVEWQQVEMHAVSAADQEIELRSFGGSFRWREGEKILVEISRKFEPLKLQQQLRHFGLSPVAHYTDPREWFSLLLFKKKRLD